MPHLWYGIASISATGVPEAGFKTEPLQKGKAAHWRGLPLAAKRSALRSAIDRPACSLLVYRVVDLLGHFEVLLHFWQRVLAELLDLRVHRHLGEVFQRCDHLLVVLDHVHHVVAVEIV